MLSARLARWSFIHSVLMVLATTISLAADSVHILLLIGALSFCFLVFMARPFWTGAGLFGPANRVTAVRLAGVLALPFLNNPVFVAGFGLALLLLDGLDGWLARRHDQASEFGEYFDKETDAFFLLVLCVLAVFRHRLGYWILIAGLLRYAFILMLHCFKSTLVKERKSSRARIMYGLVMLAMLAVFLPYATFSRLLVVAATMGLILSFVLDFFFAFSGRLPLRKNGS